MTLSETSGDMMCTSCQGVVTNCRVLAAKADPRRHAVRRGLTDGWREAGYAFWRPGVTPRIRAAIEAWSQIMGKHKC
jgi:hypothetical protein